jgi:hypothetical protein
MVAPGLLLNMISPAILRARTSRMLGETDKGVPRATTRWMVYITVSATFLKGSCGFFLMVFGAGFLCQGFFTNTLLLPDAAWLLVLTWLKR